MGSQTACTSCLFTFYMFSFLFLNVHAKLLELHHPIHNSPLHLSSFSLSLFTPSLAMGRPPCCDKSNVKRGLWTAEEDAKILAHVSKHGVGNWTSVPMKAGLNRCGKSCRLRWTNYLRPDLNHNDFTPQEEEHIINLHQVIGSRWSLIAKQLPGRTDNDVKNYWNTKLRKKLYKMGIDPVTHKPVSQILSEFGSISGLANSGHHIASRNLDKTFVPKSEASSVITGSPPTNMITRPTMEQVPEYNTFSGFNPSLDLLNKFQVINNHIVQPHFFNEVTSSCSSSSSSHVTDLTSPQSFYCQRSQAQMFTPSSSSSSSLNWSEFLLLEPIELAEEQEGDLQGLLSSTHTAILSQSDVTAQKFANEGGHYSANRSACSFGSTILGGQVSNKTQNSSMNSFVDAILDHDSELRAAFPEFLDGSFEHCCAYLDDRHFPA